MIAASDLANGNEEVKESKKPSSTSISYNENLLALIYLIIPKSKTSVLVLDSAFKQQKLTAWQPILTAGTVLPTFFVIGILFIPVGIGLWYFSENVREVTIPYTDCQSLENSSTTCDQVLKQNPQANCSCEVTFNLTAQFSVRWISLLLSSFVVAL